MALLHKSILHKNIGRNVIENNPMPIIGHWIHLINQQARNAQYGSDAIHTLRRNLRLYTIA